MNAMFFSKRYSCYFSIQLPILLIIPSIHSSTTYILSIHSSIHQSLQMCLERELEKVRVTEERVKEEAKGLVEGMRDKMKKQKECYELVLWWLHVHVYVRGSLFLCVCGDMFSCVVLDFSSWFYVYVCDPMTPSHNTAIQTLPIHIITTQHHTSPPPHNTTATQHHHHTTPLPHNTTTTQYHCQTIPLLLYNTHHLQEEGRRAEADDERDGAK